MIRNSNIKLTPKSQISLRSPNVTLKAKIKRLIFYTLRVLAKEHRILPRMTRNAIEIVYLFGAVAVLSVSASRVWFQPGVNIYLYELLIIVPNLEVSPYKCMFSLKYKIFYIVKCVADKKRNK